MPCMISPSWYDESMTTPSISVQQRAVTDALLRSLYAAPAPVRLSVLRHIPVCTDDHFMEDFDYVLGAAGSEDMLRTRLEAQGGENEVFLRLLSGACSRSTDAAATFLLDSIPGGTRIDVSPRQIRMVAYGFASSPNPSASLLDRLTSETAALNLVQGRHSSKTGLRDLLDEIAIASIKANSDNHLPLLINNRRLFDHVFSSRRDFWSMVRSAASTLSDKSLAELGRSQDMIFAGITRHHLSTDQRDKEDVSSSTIIQDQIETLASASNNQTSTDATSTLIQLLKMDLPLHPTDLGLGNRADWRILAALAPVQVPLGAQYIQMARPLLHSGSIDMVMDAMVFGTDVWWNECLDHVRREPSRLSDEMIKYVDFLEAELESRIAPDVAFTNAIDHINAINPTHASAISARLVERAPQLAYVTGSDEQRKEWSDFMMEHASSCQPMTGAMFHSIAMGMTTPPSLEVSRPAPRM